MIADEIRLRKPCRWPACRPDCIELGHCEVEPQREVLCADCEGGGWEAYGLGQGDPHMRECSSCGNPHDIECP